MRKRLCSCSASQQSSSSPKFCNAKARVTKHKARPETRQSSHVSCASQKGTLTRRAAILSTVLAACLPIKAGAAGYQDTKALYDKASSNYDELDDGPFAGFLGFGNLRKKLISKAQGTVLEVAVGTGLNLPLYDTQKVAEYTGLDLSSGMLAQASSRLRALDLSGAADLQEGNVESLPFEDNSFDSVVSTYSLCVFPHPQKALAEMARVVKPGGKVLLLEHSRSNFGPLAAYQDLTAWAVAFTSKGCVWNQDLPRLLKGAGLGVDKYERHLGGLISMAEAHV